MEKNDNEQVASPATAESPETNQVRTDSMGDDGSFFAGG